MRCKVDFEGDDECDDALRGSDMLRQGSRGQHGAGLNEWESRRRWDARECKATKRKRMPCQDE